MSTEELVFNELQNYSKTHNVTLKAPENADIVYKDECVYCFDTQFNPDGLFISLIDYVGVCPNHITKYVNKTSNRLFLNIKKLKLPPADESEEPKDKIQRLCIKEAQEKIISEHTLRLYPHLNVPIQMSSQLHPALVSICDQILAHISVEIQQRVQSGISEWDGEERPISMAANDLVQIEYHGPPISYNNWICSYPYCGLDENLWLNLSDGVICCGRFTFVGDQKGNGHAKKHYVDTGFPLVVKLGTIDNGDGDLYSYSEDSPVRDPKLKEHLAHFGLDIDKFKKTVKTTIELELDANMKHEFSAIQEEGAKLQNVYGAGFTGLINLGSSCYINSALQMLYNVPDFLRVYGQNSGKIFDRLSPAQTYEDFNCQLAKVISAMLSGKYSKENSPENGIRPTIFRRLAGRGHPEFSTAKQQDAEEYLRHLFEKIDQNTVQGSVNPVDAFRFRMVTRFEDMQSHHVRYGSREETVLSLPIPSEKFRTPSPIVVVCTAAERPIIPLEECISAAFGDDLIEGYTSPVTNQIGEANQQYRMATFPDYLIIQLRRFEARAETNFEVRKIDVDVEVADQIDLTIFRGSETLQPGEQPLLDAKYDDNTGEGEGPEESAEQKKNIAQLCDIGFTLHQAKFGLARHGWNAGRAADWLFTHLDEVPPMTASTASKLQEKTSQKSDKEMRDGSSGKYQLRAFISHMGSSPHSGHYVVHVKRDNDTWYIFNDEKVAVSQNPPTSFGYIYLYQRL